jgi:hypothetical protein
MNELQEIKEMVTEQMETEGFMRPTILLVGTKSRLGYTFTSFPGGLDAAVAKTMRRQGQQTALEHPEVGKLVRAYFAAIALLTPMADEQEPQEILTIHGVETATNEQQAIIFRVLRDRTKHSLPFPFQALEEVPARDHLVPEHPLLQAFADGYMSLD